jgi:ABC-2 type transport system ATP-binding protein
VASEAAWIALQHVAKSFGEVHALRSVTLSLNGPALVTVLGPNGAGKTTLLDLLAGLSEPTEGWVSLFGSRGAYPRQRVGVVMQREFVLDGMTVHDYAELFSAIYKVKDGMSDILARAGLRHRAKVSVERLSGGEAQRLFIAAASVHHPDILLCDEPTSALDVDHKEQVGDTLRNMAERALVVMTTHDLEFAERIADHVVILVGGELRASGEKAEVLRGHATLREAFFAYSGRTMARNGEDL